MSIVLAVIYVLATVAYLPLFYFLMKKLKNDFNDIYRDIKWKISIAFGIYMGFQIVRLIVYIDLQFYLIAYENIT